MSRSDWIGLFSSLVLHALLLFVFAFLMAATPQPEPLGFIEVDLGPMTSGRPVQRALENTPDVTAKQPDPSREVTQPAAAAPKDAKPVKLPEQTIDRADPDKVETPKTETISPETRNNTEEVKKPEPKPESQPVKPLGSGAVDGTTGAAEGSEGEGQDETKASPYQIEGLNRSALYAPLPVYREKVNADITIRISVNPQGRIVTRVPTKKANPALEQAVMEALERWRFNALPGNASYENQTGTITFRFRLQ